MILEDYMGPKGKTFIGWFFGLKLHLIFMLFGEIVRQIPFYISSFDKTHFVKVRCQCAPFY